MATGFSYYIPAPHVTKQLLAFNVLRPLLKNAKSQTPDWSTKLFTFLCAYDNHNKNFHKNNNDINNGNAVVEDDDNNDTELTAIEIMIVIRFSNHLLNFKNRLCRKFACNLQNNLLR